MHGSPTITNARSLNLISTAFLVVTFLTGIAGALRTPTLSVFLTDEVHARPAMVGFFFTGSIVIGILVSQFLAERSDRRGNRESLIVFCCLLGMLVCTLFAWNRNYFVLLFIGVFPSSFSSTANPQMFALAHGRAGRTGREAVMFNSFLRARVSLAQAIGPSPACALAMGFSFAVMYLNATVAFIVYGVMAQLSLSPMQKELPLVTGAVEAPCRNHRDALLPFAICTLIWGLNNLYIIGMSLLIISELHLPEKLAGVMMGTTAGLKILTILITRYFAKCLDKRFLMRAVVVGGICLYAGMLMVHSLVILLGLQLLNTIFIGILGGIGMFYFQDLMPGQAGSTTTLCTNASRVGWIIAGSVAGIIVETWNYYVVLWFAMMMIITTLFYLPRVKDV